MANQLTNTPQAEEIEKAVLGTMVLEQPMVSIGLSDLHPDCFYTPRNANIFNAITQIYHSGGKVDLLTIVQQLKKNGLLEKSGGPLYLSEIIDRVNSSANFEHHCGILKEQMFRRRLIKLGGELYQKGFDPREDVFDLLDLGYGDFNKISEFLQRRKNETTYSVLGNNLEIISKRMSNPTGVIGISTGFNSVDKITGGYHNTDLVVIAARPGMGKTSYMMNSAKYAAIDLKKPVVVFSLEMDASQLVLRLQSAEAELDSNDLRNGRITKDQFEHLKVMSENLKTDNLIIDDTPGLQLYQLKAKCNLYKNRHGIEAIFIDYLTLVQTNTPGNMHNKVSEITKTLKGIAKEIKVPVIVLSQLSRAVEQREDKMPMLSDLRESGSIEEDADQVIFLYRPEYYGITKNDEGESLKGICLVNIAKNRHGSLSQIPLKFIPQYTKFRDLNLYDNAEF